MFRKKERKKGYFLITDSCTDFSGTSDIAMCSKRYLLLQDGVAPGISEKTQSNLIMWLEEASSNWTSFLVFQGFFFNHDYLVSAKYSLGL